MKRLIIVCEGPTEQEFCSDVLAPHLLSRDIIVECPLIKKSGGGIISWEPLRAQLRNHLFEADAYVTMLVDYYGLKNPESIPGWEESLGIADKSQRIHFLQQQIKADMDENLRERFIPYIQLHEFEGVLFSDIAPFKRYFDAKTCDFAKLQEIITDFPNPELINSNPNSAPSKRLGRIIAGYDKVLFGGVLSIDLGLNTIRQHCPLFNEWLTTLEQI